jgi:hypothetical protein
MRLSELQKAILTLCLRKRFLTSEEILRQVFSGRSYEAGHASLSRSLTRLWQKNLILYWKTLTHYRTGITLTAEGETLAQTIMEEAEKSS